MKGKTAKKKTAQGNKGGASSGSKIMCFGKVDVILKLELTDNDIEKYKIDFDKIGSIEDVKFLENNKELWAKVTMVSMNEHFNGLMAINRGAKKKAKVELIPYGYPQVEDAQKFFEDMFISIISSNGITINKDPLDESGEFGVMLKITYIDETKKISMGSPTDEPEPKEEEGEEEGKEAKKEEGKEEEKKEGEEQAEGEQGEEGEKKEGEEKPAAAEEGEEGEKKEGEEGEEGEEAKKEEDKKEEEKKEEEKKNEPKERTLDQTLPVVKKKKEKKKPTPEGGEEGEEG